MKRSKTGYAAIALAGMLFAGSAAHAQDSLAGNFHLTNTKGPLHQADISPFKGEVSSEILAGPTNGLDVADIVYTRLAPGAKKKGLYTLPVDHTLLVLSGKMNVQLGTDEFVAAPETLVLVPAGMPFQIWNAGSEQATV